MRTALRRFARVWVPSAGLLLVAACAGVAVLPVPPRFTAIRSYEQGAVHTAAIGEPIFDVQSATTQPLFEAIVTHDPEARFVPPLEEGTIFGAVMMVQEDGSYVLYGPTYSEDFGFRVTPTGRFISLFNLRSMGNSSLPGNWPSGFVFQPVDGVIEEEGTFRAQILYGGLTGTTIRASYREFSDDMARPAFSQELQYDLAQDSVLAFRSVRILVRRATNSEIEYVVESDQDLPWLPRRP